MRVLHRFKSFVVVTLVASLVLPGSAVAQSNTCGIAVSQLQHYVVQVNAFANGEYYRGIPMRCGGNPNCMQWWLQQLNGWYMQQSGMVNGWYMQISQQCTRKRPTGGVKVDPPGQDDPGGMREEDVDQLQIDDEDKTIAIRIPSTPRGFRQ